MTLHTPLAVQPSGTDPSILTSAADFRNMLGALLGQATGTTVANEGVSSASAFAVSQRAAGANFSVDVAYGNAFIIGDDLAVQGTYWVLNDATVNVATPSPPVSGTRIHRLCLQIQDKLSNGAFSGYQAAFVIVPGTGTGDPQPLPASAIDLAAISISSGQASVLDANITDYRQRAGSAVTAWKTSQTDRTSTTTMADDPHLQLWNLTPNAHYQFTGTVQYMGGADPNNGDFKMWFRQASGAAMRYNTLHPRVSDGVQVGVYTASGTDALTAQTVGTTTDLGIPIWGSIETGSGPSQYAVLQWAQNQTSSTRTSVLTRSWLQARRVG